MRIPTLFLALAFASTASAVPLELTHQGRVFDALGQPVNGTDDLVFRIYDTPSGGSALWNETHTGTTFSNGYFTQNLGAVTALDEALFDGQELWLEVQVGASAPALPTRLPLNSVPYAIHAGEAVNVTGDITPASITVNGTTIIDSTGAWVADAPPTDVSSLISDGDLAAVAASGSYNDLTDTPTVLADLACTDGQVAKIVSGAWACASDNDTQLDEAAVDGFVANNGYAMASDIPTTGVGDTLAYANEAEVIIPEVADAYVTMQRFNATHDGALRLGFDAFIQSGPDYWAWAIEVNGTITESGSFQDGLHSSNGSAVHSYRRYEVDVAGLSAGDEVKVLMKASDGGGNGFGSGVDQLLYMKRFRIYSDRPTVHAVQGSAIFRGQMINDVAIETAEGGYVLFEVDNNSNDDVFEVVSTGNYGVRFLKPGNIMWTFDQDIISTCGYAWIRAHAPNFNDHYQLMAPTGGSWDALFNNGVTAVDAGDVLRFQIGCSGSGGISSLDTDAWSHLNILWIGQVQ